MAKFVGLVVKDGGQRESKIQKAAEKTDDKKSEKAAVKKPKQ